MARRDVQTLDSEVEFPADVQLVSTTDLRGVITYANPAFCRIAGYLADALVGQNHNLVRHPDMPKAAFADLQARIRAVQGRVHDATHPLQTLAGDLKDSSHQACLDINEHPADGRRHDPDGQHGPRDSAQHPGHQRPGDGGAQQL